MEENKNNKIGICPYLNNAKMNEEAKDINTNEDYQKEIMLSNTNPNVTQEEKKCLFVKLKKDATYINLISFYLVQFSYVCFFAFMDSMQPHLLEKKEGYINTDGYSDEEINAANYDLVFYDNLYLIVFITIFGSFHDVFGRKIVCFAGFFLISLALLFYPYATWIYPNLLLLRLLFSNGICAVTTQPLLADYVSHESKGYAGGITALLSGLGALFAVFGLMKMRSFVSIGGIYIIAAGISMFVAIFCLFGVRNVNSITQDKTFNERL